MIEWKQTAVKVYRVGNPIHDPVFATLFVDGFMNAHPNKIECRVYFRQPGGYLVMRPYVCDNLTAALVQAETEIRRSH